MNSRFIPLFIVSLLALLPCAFAQNLINNPGFETASFSSWTVTPAPSGSLLQVIPANPPTTGGSGSFIARFGATNAMDDMISQTFATLPGATYTISYFFRFADTLNPPDTNHFRVTFGGVILSDLSNVIPGFSTFTFQRMATGSSTTLEFAGFGRAGIFLDNVSVTQNAVPETGSTLLLLGLACAGMVTARRTMRRA